MHAIKPIDNWCFVLFAVGLCVVQACGDAAPTSPGLRNVDAATDVARKDSSLGAAADVDDDGALETQAVDAAVMEVAEAGAIDGATDGAVLFVSSNGTASGACTRISPCTVEQAQANVAAMRARRPSTAATVTFLAGRYDRTRTWALDEPDSGTSAAPVVYRAETAGTVRLVGARQIAPSWFVAVDSKDPNYARFPAAAVTRIVVADLGAHGFVAADLGPPVYRGWTHPGLAQTELVFDGAPLIDARWPNVGDSGGGYARTVSATSASEVELDVAANRFARWRSASSLWMFGHWAYDWSASAVQVTALDPAVSTVTLAKPVLAQGQSARPFYAFDVAEELDAPGEFWIDRASLRAYMIPPTTPLAGHEVLVTLLTTPLLRLTKTAHVRFENLSFEAVRGDAVVATDVDGIAFTSCAVKTTGQSGVRIQGSASGFDAGVIQDVGESAVVLDGGDRPSLRAGGNYVKRTRLTRFSRSSLFPGIAVSGVGHIVDQNAISDSIDNAVTFSGNNHTVSRNDIHHVLKAQSDAGAIYVGRDWGARGNVIHNNFVHDLESVFAPRLAPPGAGVARVNGVYLDDVASGITVTGNIFYRLPIAIEHASGRDVIMTNNIMIDVDVGVHVTGRSINTRPSDDGSSPGSSNLLGKLKYAMGLPATASLASPTWLAAYPALVGFPMDWQTLASWEQAKSDRSKAWLRPGGTRHELNVTWRVPTPQDVGGASDGTSTPATARPLTYWYASTANNLDVAKTDKLGLENEAALDMTLLPSSPAFKLPGFVAIPFDQIGPPP